MTFARKLDFLITTFNSSNSKLARAIRVDPSLVSKWRRGNRIPTTDSPHVPLIIDFFLNMNSLQHQKDAVMDALRPSYPDISDFGSSQTRQAITEWLFMTEGTPAGSHLPPPVSVQSASINNLLDKINMLNNSLAVSNGIRPSFKPDIFTSPGETGCYEVFKGIEGKRQAVMNFFSMVLSSNSPLELLLYSEEDIEWLVGDPQFFMKWGQLLNQILMSGHKVIIIHHVNRDPARIMSVIDQWVPLHLTGRLESYYYPRYTENVIKSTMFIARGTAAIIALTPENGRDTDYTFFHTDPIVIRLAEENYMAFLLTCRRLVKIFQSGNMTEYYREVCELEAKPGFLYVLRNGPTSLTMPEHIYNKLIGKLQLAAGESKERVALFQKRKEAFQRNLSLYKHREFINLEAFETNMENDVYTYNSLEFFSQQAVKCSTIDYIEHIQHIIGLLNKNDNYELILYKINEIDNARNMNLFVKEESSVILSTCDKLGNNPIAIITGQDNISAAFEDYFNNLVEHVPHTRRDKSLVIKKLENRVKQLKASISIDRT